MRIKRLMCALMALTVLFGSLMIGVVLAQTAGADPPTDVEVVEAVLEIGGMFGAGAPGFAIAAVIVAFLMRLSKWGRTQSLFALIPPSLRSFVPLLLGALLGVFESLATGNALGASLGTGLAAGGVQQLLYEQVKHTPIGNLVEKLLAWAPKYSGPRLA